MVIKLDVRKRFTGRPRMLTRDLFAVAILLVYLYNRLVATRTRTYVQRKSHHRQ